MEGQHEVFRSVGEPCDVTMQWRGQMSGVEGDTGCVSDVWGVCRVLGGGRSGEGTRVGVEGVGEDACVQPLEDV